MLFTNYTRSHYCIKTTFFFHYYDILLFIYSYLYVYSHIIIIFFFNLNIRDLNYKKKMLWNHIPSCVWSMSGMAEVKSRSYVDMYVYTAPTAVYNTLCSEWVLERNHRNSYSLASVVSRQDRDEIFIRCWFACCV